MAQKQIIEYVDDIDGSEAVGTTSFGLDGRTYEIDLSETHREQLEKILQPYLTAGRRVGPLRRKPELRPGQLQRPGTVLNHRVYLAQVRAWARGLGHPINDKGRIPEAVLQAYEAHHGR